MIDFDTENKRAGDQEDQATVYLVGSPGVMTITVTPEEITDKLFVYALTQDDLQFVREYDADFKY